MTTQHNAVDETVRALAFVQGAAVHIKLAKYKLEHAVGDPAAELARVQGSNIGLIFETAYKLVDDGASYIFVSMLIERLCGEMDPVLS